MRSISIGLCLFLLGGCSLGKDSRRVEGHAVLTSQEIEALRQEPLVARKEAVLKEYEDFLKRYDRVDPALKSQALKRLGDLYLETANQHFLKAMEAYEIHPEGPPPLVDYTKAIEAYNKLLSSDPGYRENDQVLYSLSRAYAETGERELVGGLLERLLNDYPKSRYRQETTFRLGEYYFDQHQYEKAAKAYEQSLSLGDPFFLDKTQYKLGWTYFNMKEYPRAIENFLRLMSQKAVSEGGSPSERGSLVWEAMTYVATSFRILGGAVPLSAYFQEKGSRSYEKDLYLMIGNQYLSEGDPQAAIETYRMFIRQHPLHPMAPIFSSYIIEVYEKQKKEALAQEVRIQLVKDYSSRSPWYRSNDEAARVRSRSLVKEVLYRLALVSHSHAQEVKSEEDYRKAAGWYREFLTEFPNEKEFPDVHLFLAETLFALKEFAQAGEEYETAAYSYPEKGANSKAAYDAIVAYEKVKTKEGDQKVIDLAKRYSAAFPQDPKVPALLLKAGEILFESKRYDETRGVLGELLVRYPKQDGSTTAQKLIAHSYMQTGRFEEARQAYRLVLPSLPVSDTKGRQEIADLLAASIYKQGEDRKKQNRLEEAAHFFEDVTEEAPQSELAPQALFEAGTIREGMNQTKAAIAIHRKLVLLFPNSTLSGKAQVQIGLLFEKEGDWIQSADAYASAAQVIPEESLVPHLLFTAGLFYEKGALWEKSYNSFSEFTQRFPQDPDAAEALYKMALARQKQRKVQESLKLFDQVAQKFPETPFAAEALFQTGEEAFKNLKVIRLAEPLAKSLKKKTKALEKTVTLYRKAIETRYAEVVTASSHRLGEIFEDFKSSLLNAEVPRKLKEEEREEYRFQLEEKAFPFEEKAIEAYSSNVRRVQNQNSPYDAWIKKSYERLAELRPSLFRRTERAERVVTVIDTTLLSTQTPEEPRGSMVKARR